jgi:hypothetical protein
VILVGREEPDLVQKTLDAADEREHQFDVSVFEVLKGVEERGFAAAWGLEDAVDEQGMEVDVSIQGTPRVLHRDHGIWATRVEAGISRATSKEGGEGAHEDASHGAQEFGR